MNTARIQRPLRILAVTALLLTTQVDAVSPAAAQTAASGPLVVPTILPLTGPVAFFGQAVANTLRLVEEKVNREGGIRGRSLHFDVRDDQGNPVVAVQITQQL